MRIVTGLFCGTGMQRGTKANWVAMIRTVTEPSGSTLRAEIILANSLLVGASPGRSSRHGSADARP